MALTTVARATIMPRSFGSPRLWLAPAVSVWTTVALGWNVIYFSVHSYSRYRKLNYRRLSPSFEVPAVSRLMVLIHGSPLWKLRELCRLAESTRKAPQRSGAWSLDAPDPKGLVVDGYRHLFVLGSE